MKIIAFTGAGIIKNDTGISPKDLRRLNKLLTVKNKKNNLKYFNKAKLILTRYNEKRRINDTYLALAEYDIPVITINTDMLHQKAGSSKVCELLGNVYDDSLVTYGEDINDWSKAADIINSCGAGDIFLVIGVSAKTPIVQDFIVVAASRKMKIIEITKEPERTRKIIEEVFSQEGEK